MKFDILFTNSIAWSVCEQITSYLSCRLGTQTHKHSTYKHRQSCRVHHIIRFNRFSRFYICGQACFAIAQKHKLNFCRCKLSWMASNPRNHKYDIKWKLKHIQYIHGVAYCTYMYCTVLYCTVLYCTYCTYCTYMYCTVHTVHTWSSILYGWHKNTRNCAKWENSPFAKTIHCVVYALLPAYFVYYRILHTYVHKYATGNWW